MYRNNVRLNFMCQQYRSLKSNYDNIFDIVDNIVSDIKCVPAYDVDKYITLTSYIQDYTTEQLKLANQMNAIYARINKYLRATHFVPNLYTIYENSA